MILRRSMIILLILLILLMTGISFVSADSQEIPNLVGNWSGTCVGYTQDEGYNSFSDLLLFLTITEQKGQVFNGTLFFQKKNKDHYSDSTGFSGAIGPDMKTFYLAEYKKGYSMGSIIDKNTLQYIFLLDGEKGLVTIDNLTRDTQ